jgi:hypothetical protein
MFTRVAARTDRLPPAGPFLEVLQAIRRLLTRPEYFRLEREFAGPDFHRGEQCTFSRHTYQSGRTRDPPGGARAEEPSLCRKRRRRFMLLISSSPYKSSRFC